MKISRDSVALQPIANVLAKATIRGCEVVRIALTRVVAIGASTPTRIALDWRIVGCGCGCALSPLLAHPLFMSALRGDTIPFDRVCCTVDTLSISARSRSIPNAALCVARFL